MKDAYFADWSRKCRKEFLQNNVPFVNCRGAFIGLVANYGEAPIV